MKPIFQRRHYEFIADLLRKNDKVLNPEVLARALQDENLKFKPSRFYNRVYKDDTSRSN